MPTEIRWYIPKRVIYSRPSGTFTAEDATKTREAVEALFEQAEFPVYGISDDHHLQKTELSLPALRDALSFLRRFDYMVKVGDGNKVTEFFWSVTTQFFRIKLKQVATLEDAEVFLRGLDNTLNFQDKHPV